ncbi:MAG: GNAT family N-acetyltransferase [Saprospiraceae bacterium]
MANYKILNKQIFIDGHCAIVPIRMEDRYKIMAWRNEQIYHLRQSNPLTAQDQDLYFKTVVDELFDNPQPSQLLFSYLDKGECIGYGGLVHINWIDQNAEISFIMDTAQEKDHFEVHWNTYLKLIEEVAFKELRLHKIYTFAFDLRPLLYPVLVRAGFKEEARLKEHCYFQEKFVDVLIHTRLNQ